MTVQFPTPDVVTVRIADVSFDQDLYPRENHDPALVQKYADSLDQIEAMKRYISIATDGTLLDGRHRQMAYLKAFQSGEERPVPVFRYGVTEARDKFALAVRLNSDHGAQLKTADKERDARELYAKYRYSLDEIADLVSTSKTKVSAWLSSTIKDERERRNKRTFDLWLACYTQEEVALEVDLGRQTVTDLIKELPEKYRSTGSAKLVSVFDDADWTPPLYNIWKFSKLADDQTTHFGNSAQEIVDRLLYLHTAPFDVVVDPFGGGGSTIDVCKKRLRRYWVADRHPPIERPDVREADIADGPPRLPWSDVALLYLDPPYWRQAQGEYSDDPADLANMDIDAFYAALVGYVKACADKMRDGAHVALLIQPTQWRADDRKMVDHVFDLARLLTGKRLEYEMRVICPYATEQYNAQQVEWAKANKQLLILNRELIIWRVRR